MGWGPGVRVSQDAQAKAELPAGGRGGRAVSLDIQPRCSSAEDDVEEFQEVTRR